jgi:isoprenylcysteine carboxyl methyltransferase (ICMT) family protein YpbQ/SAM-dependent methyltransferase
MWDDEKRLGLFLVIAIVVFFIERMAFLLQKSHRKAGERYYEWLTRTLFVMYIIIVLSIFAEAIFYPELNLRWTILGITTFLIGIVFRRLSRRALGDLWSMHIEIMPIHKVIDSGIYKYVKHPYSTSVILELLGLSIMLQSLAGVVLTMAIQLPLLLIRNRFEEKALEIKSKKKEANANLFEVIKVIGLRKLFSFFPIINVMKKYNRYYMLANCMTAFLNLGFFDQLDKSKWIDIREYAQKNNFDINICLTICGFLFAHDILEKKGEMVRVTKKGEFLANECRGPFNFITAYQPIFENLEDIISRKKQYGKDVKRRPEYVARASEDLAKRFPFPVSKAVLSQYGFASILDLGCGTGEFLEFWGSGNNTKLFGIDISPEAIEYGRKKLARQNIELEVCDMFDIQALKKTGFARGDDPKVITSFFVLHEFAQDGIDCLIEYFKKIKAGFPSAYLFIFELYLHDWSTLRQTSSPIKEHHLFHYLSNQALVTREDWRKIFNESKYTIVEDKLYTDFGQGYFLLKP